jgi:sugar (pentulose or hexulose) kinase
VRHLGIDFGTASVKLLLLGEDGYDVSVSRPVETLCRWC